VIGIVFCKSKLYDFHKTDKDARVNNTMELALSISERDSIIQNYIMIMSFQNGVS